LTSQRVPEQNRSLLESLLWEEEKRPVRSPNPALCFYLPVSISWNPIVACVFPYF